MKGRDGGPRQLGIAVLHLFERAVAGGNLDVAEHLMQALEELARSQPACEDLVERAYLRIARGRANTSHVPSTAPRAAATTQAIRGSDH